MRRLIIMRHAKSDWSNPSDKDFDRSLNERGHRVAPKMGGQLLEMGIKPDLIVSSPAERAKLTAEYVTEQLDYALDDINFDEELYNASVRVLLREVNNFSDELKEVLLIAHNPGLTYFAEYLTGEEIGNLPTCGAVCVEFENDSWAEVSKDLGTMKWFIYPKKFDF